MASRTIEVGALARVEGEGGLTIRFKGREVRSVELRIFEPPRFFEALLRGRRQGEAPDITARICGICPVAYQMSACHAVEDAHGVRLPEPLRALRRLLYCGEWIESHALHVFMLHAPDFLGYPDAVTMAKDHGAVVKRGLSIKKVGNALLEVLGGRAIHPVNVRVGGFYRAPSREELRALLPDLERARDEARLAVPWVAGLPFPDLERDWEMVALRHPTEYPMNEGRVASTAGLDIPVAEYEEHFEERHVAHSTALHSALRARGDYLTGPLARFALNADRLPADVLAVARAAGLSGPCRNPFKSVIVRAVELLFALEEAVRLVRAYAPPERPFVEVPDAAGVGRAATEAPRGLLFHRYRVDAAGLIAEARIVPPTAQNLPSMEADLRALGPQLIERPHAEATHLAEQAVRNHDPCISCATHFLTLRREEEA